MKTLIRALPLLLLLLPASASARDGKIEVDPGDTPLAIKGWVGDENSFVGNLRLTLREALQNATPVKLIVLTSDLKRTQGAEVVGRQQVTLTGEQTLAPETPSTFQVKVLGIKTHGEYTGHIELMLPGQPRAQALTIPLNVTAAVRPALTLMPESDRLKANLVNCGLNCTLARYILPASSLQSALELHFEKPLDAPLDITEQNFFVKGEQSDFQLTKAHMGITLATPMPAPSPSPSPTQRGFYDGKRYVDFRVNISEADLPADHYIGSLYIQLAGLDTPVKVPVDFNVRVGPTVPLLFLTVGILLGRLFKYMQEKGHPTADALVTISRVENRMQDANPEDAAIIQPTLEQARRMVNEGQVEEATALVKSAGSRLATLNELRDVELRLAGKEQHPKVKEIIQNLARAREMVRQGSDADVKTHVEESKKALLELSVTMMGSGEEPDPSIKAAAESAEAAAAASERAARAAASAPAAAAMTAGRRFRSWLNRLTGVSDEFRSEATRWLLRPLMWLLLIVALMILGMKTLYIDNPVFGSNPFTDFASLIFWGLSAEVAGRTLSNIQFTKPSQPSNV